MPAILECQGLTKTYGGTLALNGVTLSLPPGRIVGLLGPNGSGKTTLIKLAAGLLTPTQGQVLVGGMLPGPQTKAIVSYLPERNYLPAWMRISDCLDFFETFYRDFDRRVALDMLARLQVPLTARFKTLSKGTKEKVQLVLVMSRHAHLYLLDEPIAGVDPATRDYILRTIVGNYNRSASILISTHLIADVESVLDDFVLLHYGNVAACSSVAAVKAQGSASLDAYFREAFYVR
ncbi:MAG: ABC transporter ATP-binding protein [Coriobacteriales bacterium]|jgi:ABC-2 type transport system ATP-binding protein|nr:ABC transporter ATP-binding protein [Coriobacteriales bacterium]